MFYCENFVKSKLVNEKKSFGPTMIKQRQECDYLPLLYQFQVQIASEAVIASSSIFSQEEAQLQEKTFKFQHDATVFIMIVNEEGERIDF